MHESVARRLRWFLLLGVVTLSAGVVVGCVEALRTSAWMVEFADVALTDEDMDRWLWTTHLDNKLADAVRVLVPFGVGTLVTASAAILVVSKGRFSVRSLLVGLTFVCLLIGLPLGFVRPRLQNPRFVYRPDLADVTFEQHRDPAANGSYSLLDRRTAPIAALPLATLPIILLVPRRGRSRLSDA